MIALIPNCGFISETSRMLAIAQALQARGVPTRIASQGGPYAHLLDEAGVEWTRLAPGADPGFAGRFLDALLDMGRGNTPLYSTEFLREAIAAEVDFLRETGAVMAVIGFNLPTLLSARVAGIPLAASHGGSWVPPVLDRGLCPIPVNPPDPNMAKLPAFAQRWLSNVVPKFLRAPIGTLDAMAAELGVTPIGSLAGLMLGDLTMVTDIPEIVGIGADELAAWRPSRLGRFPRTSSLRYTGPLFAKLDRPIPEEVQAFLDAPDPVVYLTPTSVHEPLLRQMISATRAAGTRVLVGATIHDVADMADERTLIAGVLPNHLVMPQVDVAVMMGGQGSVQTAMTSGVPFVGLPWHGEQELNVALAERQGMAIRLSPAHAGGPALTAAVRRLLTDPAAKAAAARVRELYAPIDGAALAADAILDFLAARGVDLGARLAA